MSVLGSLVFGIILILFLYYLSWSSKKSKNAPTQITAPTIQSPSLWREIKTKGFWNGIRDWVNT